MGCQYKALHTVLLVITVQSIPFSHYRKAKIFPALCQAGFVEYDNLQGVSWSWQRIDDVIMKALLAREFVGAN